MIPGRLTRVRACRRAQRSWSATPTTGPRMNTTPTASSQVIMMKTTPIGPYSLLFEMSASERKAAENAPRPEEEERQ